VGQNAVIGDFKIKKQVRNLGPFTRATHAPGTTYIIHIYIYIYIYIYLYIIYILSSDIPIGSRRTARNLLTNNQQIANPRSYCPYVLHIAQSPTFHTVIRRLFTSSRYHIIMLLLMLSQLTWSSFICME